MKQYLKLIWLTETIRLIEKEAGRFADEDANRQARASGGSIATRIMKRATIISEQNGLLKVQQDWLNATKVSLFILSVIAIFIGAGLAFSALAQNPVNLYWALLSLLGLHVVTVILWIFSAIFIPHDSGTIFIHLWLWLSKKLSRKNTISQLLPAFITLLGSQIRWLIGTIVNFLWFVMLFSALVVLIALFSTKNYSFEWQTTLLSSDTVIAITHYLGIIPNLLGFSIPDNDTIRLSEQALAHGEVRSAWAIWLLGTFIVYGVGVRFLLMIFCGLKLVLTSQQVKLDLQQPEYQTLANELELSITKSVIDKESNNPKKNNQSTEKVVGYGSVLVAIDVEASWQPAQFIPSLGSDAANFSFLNLGILNNSEQRKNALDYLQTNPAKKLLIAVDTDRTPDRGIINLIKQLIIKSEVSKVWFIHQGRQLENWQQSLVRLNISNADPTWLTEGSNNVE